MARRSSGPWFRRSKNAWYVWHDGKQTALGVRGPGNRPAALVAWHKIMAGVTNDSGPAVKLPPPEPQPLTVRELVDGYLADCAGRVKPKTLETYRYLLGPFAEQLGRRPTPTLTAADAEAFSRRPSWSASTRHDFLLTLVSAVRWAVRTRHLEADPLVGLRKPPKASRGAQAVVTGEMFAKLHKAAGPTLRPFLTGLWLTGCRPGELAALTAADVDLAHGVALLAAHKTADKMGKPRVLFLSPEAAALFRRQAEAHPSGPLFPNRRGGHYTVWAVVQAMRMARQRSGVEAATAYGFRHGYATEALARGVPDAQVAALLGHTGTAMLHKHYSHLTSRAAVLRAAATQVRAPLNPDHPGGTAPTSST